MFTSVRMYTKCMLYPFRFMVTNLNFYFHVCKIYLHYLHYFPFSFTEVKFNNSLSVYPSSAVDEPLRVVEPQNAPSMSILCTLHSKYAPREHLL